MNNKTKRVKYDKTSYTLHDIAQDFGLLICEEVESYGEDATFLEGETCIEIVS